MDRTVFKFLQKVAAGGKGALDAAVLDVALPLIGVTMETAVSAELIKYDDKRVKTLFADYAPISSKGNSIVLCRWVDDADSNAAAFHQLGVEEQFKLFRAAFVEVPATGPTDPQPGVIYYHGATTVDPGIAEMAAYRRSEIKKGRGDPVTRYGYTGDPAAWKPARVENGIWIKKVWRGTDDGLRFSLPGATDLKVAIAPNENMSAFTSTALWAWLYQHGGKEKAASALMNVDSKTATKLARPNQMRTLENTGSCGICGRNIKLNAGGRIWDHGYTRPGYGFYTASCFGRGYEPYEVSPAACVAYIARLDKLREVREGQLAQLAAGTATVEVDIGQRRAVVSGPGPEGTTVSDALVDRRFFPLPRVHSQRRAYDDIVAILKQELVMIAKDRADTVLRVSNWAPGELPTIND